MRIPEIISKIRDLVHQEIICISNALLSKFLFLSPLSIPHICTVPQNLMFYPLDIRSRRALWCFVQGDFWSKESWWVVRTRPYIALAGDTMTSKLIINLKIGFTFPWSWHALAWSLFACRSCRQKIPLLLYFWRIHIFVEYRKVQTSGVSRSLSNEWASSSKYQRP